jgi:DNA-binding HxlR family transcriptional regulator
MRSYGQFCAAAKALDVLGDRWTLLLVRELLLAGPSRYTDLRNGLPGIATNLLSERLRELEDAGILEREEAPPPVATTLYRLTPRGEAIRPVIDELIVWGIPYMVEGPAPEDAFRGHWMGGVAEMFLTDIEPDGPPVSLELRAGEESVVLEIAGGEVRVRAGSGPAPDARLTGSPVQILAVLSGQTGVEQALSRGLGIEGDAGVLDRLRPGDQRAAV